MVLSFTMFEFQLETVEKALSTRDSRNDRNLAVASFMDTGVSFVVTMSTLHILFSCFPNNDTTQVSLEIIARTFRAVDFDFFYIQMYAIPPFFILGYLKN